MCWCRPEIRTPQCDRPGCHPPAKRNGHNLNEPGLKPGDCDLCGNWSGNLDEGACQGCVAFYKLA